MFALTGLSVETFVDAVQTVPMMGTIARFGVAFPLTFHLLGGIRHLVWDNAQGHEIQEVNKTGYAVLGASVLAAAVLALMEFEKDAPKTQ